MQSRDYIFWEVDVQADFMLPGGRLYVPGAEKLLPNIRKLTDAARRGEVFLVSHRDFHPANDPEFQQFPPHCLKGTAGAELVPEALTGNFVRVENDANAKLPEIFRSTSRSFWRNKRSTFLKLTTPAIWWNVWGMPQNSWCLES